MKCLGWDMDLWNSLLYLLHNNFIIKIFHSCLKEIWNKVEYSWCHKHRISYWKVSRPPDHRHLRLCQIVFRLSLDGFVLIKGGFRNELIKRKIKFLESVQTRTDLFFHNYERFTVDSVSVPASRSLIYLRIGSSMNFDRKEDNTLRIVSHREEGTSRWRRGLINVLIKCRIDGKVSCERMKRRHLAAGCRKLCRQSKV